MNNSKHSTIVLTSFFFTKHDNATYLHHPLPSPPLVALVVLEAGNRAPQATLTWIWTVTSLVTLRSLAWVGCEGAPLPRPPPSVFEPSLSPAPPAALSPRPPSPAALVPALPSPAALSLSPSPAPVLSPSPSPVLSPSPTVPVPFLSPAPSLSPAPFLSPAPSLFPSPAQTLPSPCSGCALSPGSLWSPVSLPASQGSPGCRGCLLTPAGPGGFPTPPGPGSRGIGSPPGGPGSAPSPEHRTAPSALAGMCTPSWAPADREPLWGGAAGAAQRAWRGLVRRALAPQPWAAGRVWGRQWLWRLGGHREVGWTVGCTSAVAAAASAGWSPAGAGWSAPTCRAPLRSWQARAAPHGGVLRDKASGIIAQHGQYKNTTKNKNSLNRQYKNTTTKNKNSLIP